MLVVCTPCPVLCLPVFEIRNLLANQSEWSPANQYVWSYFAALSYRFGKDILIIIFNRLCSPVYGVMTLIRANSEYGVCHIFSLCDVGLMIRSVFLLVIIEVIKMI